MGRPRDVLLDLSDEISANISGLGVDAPSDSAEKSDGGTTETVSGDALVQASPVVLEVEQLEGDDGEEEDEESESTEEESHDGSRPEGGHEGRGNALPGLESGPSVGVGGDDHAEVAAEGTGDGAQDERRRREDGDEKSRGDGASVDVGRVLGLESVLGSEQHEDDHAENAHEVEDELVLGGQKRLGSILDRFHDVGDLRGDRGVRSGSGLEERL